VETVISTHLAKRCRPRVLVGNVRDVRKHDRKRHGKWTAQHRGHNVPPEVVKQQKG
jgi:hypothetical protein